MDWKHWTLIAVLCLLFGVGGYLLGKSTNSASGTIKETQLIIDALHTANGTINNHYFETKHKLEIKYIKDSINANTLTAPELKYGLDSLSERFFKYNP